MALFVDGSSLEHWKMYGASSDSISPKWAIDQGVLIASVDGDGIGENTGFDESIMTKNNFEILSLN
ncbi:MAG: hypothetical protein JJ966_02520 [Balneolaceae bacterium]|nr:hypothetical protein [Balneolaceae bacterium]